MKTTIVDTGGTPPNQTIAQNLNFAAAPSPGDFIQFQALAPNGAQVTVSKLVVARIWPSTVPAGMGPELILQVR